MAIFRVTGRAAARLVELPESGMGFQVLRYRDTFFIALNATVLFPIVELSERGISENDYSLLSGDPDSPQVSELEPIELDGGFSVVFSHLDRSIQDPELVQSFKLSFSETASSPPESVIPSRRPHSYYRFCAYFRDMRVDRNTGNLLPGTYATTYNDLHFVPSGFAAVGRYALPNPASAMFVFQIVTYDRPTMMGTAPPNFGQAGGGVEVLFQSGARNIPGLSFMINVG